MFAVGMINGNMGCIEIERRICNKYFDKRLMETWDVLKLVIGMLPRGFAGRLMETWDVLK